MSSSKEHMWKKGPGVAEEQGQNVLDALPSDAYKWKQGEYEAPTNVLDSLPEDRQKWHKYTPEKSPLDQLSDAHYSWKGPGAQARPASSQTIASSIAPRLCPPLPSARVRPR